VSEKSSPNPDEQEEHSKSLREFFDQFFFQSPPWPQNHKITKALRTALNAYWSELEGLFPVLPVSHRGSVWAFTAFVTAMNQCSAQARTPDAKLLPIARILRASYLALVTEDFESLKEPERWSIEYLRKKHPFEDNLSDFHGAQARAKERTKASLDVRLERGPYSSLVDVINTPELQLGSGESMDTVAWEFMGHVVSQFLEFIPLNRNTLGDEKSLYRAASIRLKNNAGKLESERRKSHEACAEAIVRLMYRTALEATGVSESEAKKRAKVLFDAEKTGGRNPRNRRSK
jgi:hypothetical protein